MSIEPTLAKIPTMTADQRKVLRANAEAKLASGDPKWAVDAPSVLVALDAFDEEQGRVASQQRGIKIADLKEASAVERIVLAFELEPTTQAEEKMIQILLDHPGSTATQLTDLHGWVGDAWDLQYGGMCARRREYLWPLEPAVREGDAPNIDMLTVKTRGEDGTLRYHTKPEAVEAFKLLGFRVMAE
jgi:hypothetical protein